VKTTKQNILKILNLKDPYTAIEKIENGKNYGGWNSNSSNFSLAKNKKMCLEIGAWMGNSAKMLCTYIPDDGILICVDSFIGSHEHFIEGSIPINSYNKPMLYEYFLDNTFNHQQKIIPIMLSSSAAMEVFRRFDIFFDFIYIDGDHRAAAVYDDLKESYDRLNIGGAILGDDYSWGTVRDGLKRFKDEFNVDYVVQNGQFIINK
jgi:hypothetical protein